MSLYIEIFDGLEKSTMMHLIQIADQTNDLSFSSTSYQYPLSPSSKFISVNFNPTNWFAKGDILNSVTNNYTLNGDVLIAPRASHDTVLLQDGSEPYLKDLVGMTEFYNNSITGGWDALIYYDVTSSGSKDSPINYVTKDISANCIFSPSHIILYHELFHAGNTVTVPIPQKMLDLFANADYLNPTDLKGTIEIDSDENIETQNAEEFDEPFDGMLWRRFITAYEELFTSLYGDIPALNGLSFLVTNLNEMLKDPDTLDFSELKSNVDSLRQELLLASRFGLSMAIPQSVIEYDVPTVQEDILNRGISTINEIESRMQKIRKIVIDNFSEIVTFDGIPPTIAPIGTQDEIDTFVSSHDKIIQINNCLKILFGKSFTVMPQFTLSPVIQNEVITSINTFDISKQNKITWFQQASQTHKQLKKFEDFSMLKTAMNNIDDLDFSVCQLPHPDNNQLIGIQTDDLGEEQQAVRSLVFYSPTNIDLQQSVSGIILDQWNESIPNKKETTGIAYNYNRPSNEAPNAILLVVPLVIEQTHATWKWSYLVNAIDETLDLAKIRAVDLHAYKDLGAFLPALYIPTNLFNTKGILPYYGLILDYTTSGGSID